MSRKSLISYTCANSVDPDETARYEPSHQDLHCFTILCFIFELYSDLLQWTCPNSKVEKSTLEPQG